MAPREAASPSYRLVSGSFVLCHVTFIKRSSGADHVLQKKHKDPEEKNSALLYYVHFGNIADPRLRAVLTFIVHVIREPAFSQLRTVEQLGCAVLYPSLDF